MPPPGERVARRRRLVGQGKMDSQGSETSRLKRSAKTLPGPAAAGGGELTVCLSNAVAPKPRAASRRSEKRGAGAVSCRPATRAASARAAAAEHNASAPLLRLHDGPLARVLAELQAPDLARLECVCRFFGAAGAGGLSLVAATALARLPALRREMPPWYATLGPLARLLHEERRARPLAPADVAPGLWLRVRPDLRAVQALCEPRDGGDDALAPPAAGDGDGDGDDDAMQGAARGASLPRAYVGWNDKMVDTLGRCFPVLGEVDEHSWDVPVVGLRVPRGWACVAPPFGRRHECRAPCTGGWFYPLQALERV